MIKFYIFAIFFTFITHTHCHAEGWEFDLKDALYSEKVDGHEQYHVKMKVIDYYLQQIQDHAGQYPPVFKDMQERAFIETKLKHLIGFLEVLNAENKDPEMQLCYAWALAMGHNLDFSGSGEKAIKIFDKILARQPEYVRANYLYGVFLFQAALPDKAIPYLEKSVKNGMKNAKWQLALIYLADKNSQPKAVRLLEEYVQDFPADQQAKDLLQSLKSGNIKIERIYHNH